MLDVLLPLDEVVALYALLELDALLPEPEPLRTGETLMDVPFT
ncbi:MAG: hypothetical protein ACPLRU_03380 [Desulfofundulus sp.]